jgi:DNA repair exonuclease SbcCD ATPase subunit
MRGLFVSCTQEELLQVLQKLMHERQKVKTLEKRLQATSSASLSVVPPQHIVAHELTNPVVMPCDHEKEIEVLKNVIKDLGEKLKATAVQQPQIVESPGPVDENIAKLKQSLYQSQNEVRATREKASLLEEEIRRLQQFRASLQTELKEQGSKTHEVERLKALVDDYQIKIADLEKRIVENTKKASENKESETREHVLEAQIEDQKLLYSELAVRNKELDTKLLALLSEKQQMQMLLQQESTKATEMQQKAFALEKKLEEAAKAEQASQSQIMELSRSIDRLKEKEREFIQLQTTSNEQKNQIDVLEQHLARRIRECTLLTKTNEEQNIELTRKDEKLVALTSELSTLKEESLAAIEAYKQQIAECERDILTLNSHVEEMYEELQELRALEEKYLLLEEVAGQLGHIIAPKRPAFDTRKQFGRPLKKEPVLPKVNNHQDLFAPTKEVPSYRHDLFQ